MNNNKEFEELNISNLITHKNKPIYMQTNGTDPPTKICDKIEIDDVANQNGEFTCNNQKYVVMNYPKYFIKKTYAEEPDFNNDNPYYQGGKSKKAKNQKTKKAKKQKTKKPKNQKTKKAKKQKSTRKH